MNKKQPILKIGTIEENFNGSPRLFGWRFDFSAPRQFLYHEIKDGKELWCGWTIGELMEIAETGIIPDLSFTINEIEEVGDLGPPDGGNLWGVAR